MLTLVLATLAKLVVILNLGLRNIFSNIYTPAQHPFNFFSFRIVDKANSTFNSKIREALHINWAKLYLNAQHFYYSLRHLFVPFCLWIFCLSLPSIIFIISGTNYRLLLLFFEEWRRIWCWCLLFCYDNGISAKTTITNLQQTPLFVFIELLSCFIKA